MPVFWDEAGLAELLTAAAEFRDEKALEIAVSAEPPRDTGFLAASVYIYSAISNTFDGIWPSDYYTSTKTGYLVAREAVDEPPIPPENGVIIGWAAIYAWFVEDDQSFIYNALIGATEGGIAAQDSGGGGSVSEGGGSSGGGVTSQIASAGRQVASAARSAGSSIASAGRSIGRAFGRLFGR